MDLASLPSSPLAIHNIVRGAVGEGAATPVSSSSSAFISASDGETKARTREKERWRRVMMLLNELRSLHRQIDKFPDVLEESVRAVRDIKELQHTVEEKELQGMMMVFNFLHPDPLPCAQGAERTQSEELRRVLGVFDAFRTFLQGRITTTFPRHRLAS